MHGQGYQEYDCNPFGRKQFQTTGLVFKGSAVIFDDFVRLSRKIMLIKGYCSTGKKVASQRYSILALCCKKTWKK